MGARKKGAAAAGQEKRQGQYMSGSKQKMFQTEMSEEDSDSGSDFSMEEMPVSKKTPNKVGQTPKQNQSGKKDTPASAKGSGMKSLGAKVEKMNPPIKGKVFSSKAVKRSLEQGSDSDEEDSDDDDFDDEDMDENDDDLEDDDEDDEDIRRTLLAMQGKKVPKSNGIEKTKQDTPKAKTPKKAAFETPKSASKANKQAETPKSTAKSNTASGSPEPMNQAGQSRGPTILPPETWALEAQRRRERDLKTLFVRGIPKEVTAEELKEMSPDILDVKIPSYTPKKSSRNKKFFAFLEFASEKKAEENYTLLQNKKVRGQTIFVDYAGEKSKNKEGSSTKDIGNITFNKRMLIVTGYPDGTTIAKIAPLFPKAVNVCLNRMRDSRSISILFDNDEDASEAYSANSKAVIDGRLVTVLFAMKKPHPKRKQSKQNQKNQPPAKKRNISSVPKKKPAPSQEPESSDNDDEDNEE